MAIYNEILAGRFARGIQKIFSMKGGVPTRQLSGELMTTFEMDKATALENRIVHSVRSFTRSTVVAAGGAGNRSAYRLRNLPGSNVVAILEKLTFVAVLADTPFLNRGPTGTGDLTTIDSGNVSIRDLRMGPVNSSLILSFSTAAALTGVQELQVGAAANSQADGILTVNQEIVIAPGDLVTLYANTLNQGMVFTLMWRERSLEESELSA